MELGIAGRKAIVCGASRGLGKACAMALASEGVDVTINGRDPAVLETAAEAIRAVAPDTTVTTVVGSVAAPDVREALLATCRAPDILVNNAGGPPPGDFREWERQTWITAVDTNLLAAVELIRLTLDGMTERGFGRIVNITSSAVRLPIPTLGLSNAMRAALTNFVFGLVPQVSARGVTINNLLPGPFDTDRLRATEALSGRPIENAIAGRLGDPAEFGAACAFLCSRHAGYLTGQNILLDGGLISVNP